MKVAIILCSLFAVTLAAVRPMPAVFDDFSEKVEIRPNTIGFPAVERGSGQDKIVAGGNAEKGKYPYQVSLQKLGSSWYHTCGASIINTKYILTAAHCIDGSSPSQLRAVAGEYDFNTAEATEQTIGVSALTIHPQWNRPTINYDIGVVRLSGSFVFGSSVAAINLATSTPADGTSSWVTGWGRLQYQGAVPTKLQYLATERESDYWGNRESSIYDASSQVASYNYNKGICNGDSGGPLVYQTKDGDWEQYGVVSYYMIPCGSTKSDYYARVATFHSWVLNNAKA